MSLAFPGATGWGVPTRHMAESGTPTVIKVTNRNPSGAGSFKAAAEASVPRLIVFEVGGAIESAGIITIDDPYCYIAGQTAPDPGIQLRGATLEIKTHDVLVQHITIGRGDDPAQAQSCLNLVDATDSIVDHCSLYWATSTAVRVQRATRCTISYCLIGEPLWTGWGSEAINASPATNDVNNNVSFHHNVHVHCHTRNPTVRYQHQTEFAMNVIYNFGPDDGDTCDIRDIAAVDKTMFLDIWSNTYIDGPDSGSGATHIIDGSSAANAPGTSSRIYVGEAEQNGNVHYVARPDDDSTDVWDVVDDTYFPSGTFQSLTPTVASSQTLNVATSAGDVYTQIVVNGNVGSRPYTTDTIRERMLYEVVTHTGNLKDTVADAGGWPTLTPTTRVFNVPVNPFADDDQDGYTNIERFIHENYIVGPHSNDFPPADVGSGGGTPSTTEEVVTVVGCPKRYRAIPLFDKNRTIVATRYVDARTQEDVTDAALIAKLKDCGS